MRVKASSASSGQDAAQDAAVPRPSGAPRVLLHGDMQFPDLTLSQILCRAGIRVSAIREEKSVLEVLDRLQPSVDLLMLHISDGPPQAIDALVRGVRAIPTLAETPILGFTRTSLDQSCLRLLRSLGMAGLVQEGASPEQVLFRVRLIVSQPPVFRRQHRRAPVSFPVSLVYQAESRPGHAIDLSVGGIRVATDWVAAINTELTVRFTLEEYEICVDACVAHTRPATSRMVAHELGLFFRNLDATADRLVLQEVARCLSQVDHVW